MGVLWKWAVLLVDVLFGLWATWALMLAAGRRLPSVICSVFPVAMYASFVMFGDALFRFSCAPSAVVIGRMTPPPPHVLRAWRGIFA